MSAVATFGGAGLIVLGAYLVFAFDRLGLQGFFAPRAPVRLILTGVYGWMWLVGSMWLTARFVFGNIGPIRPLVLLVGHAHLPLLLLAIFIQIVSVTLDTTGPAFWLALFASGLWMPAMLVAAAFTALDLSRRQSLAAVGLAYSVWAVVVGRTLWTQLEHLF